ncbi:hypothetical protein SAMN00777080_4743 [Aquiflexum balticum DSM 16537]|uniref:Methyltransferase domain-containing protein n=1 Tax=Aquiflexum balticum DSM 16537 TaxID=758820 RepID=A0A1W2HB81_9BACT|nr:hypothetical protein [Aquiflexum balticum]SMD46064.1 hypothetical protein SAMN00777080_4743 [Aquiflexum balticum DSM 16537]
MIKRKLKNLKAIIKNRLFKKEIDSFWIQEVMVYKTQNRIQVFDKYLMRKKVLHIGCTDFPIFDPKNNLHIQISNKCKELHGLDIDFEGIEVLKKHFDGKYYTSMAEVSEDYDTVLVPETIEHVENIKKFLNEMEKINARNYIISAPNCFNSHFKHGFLNKKNNIFREIIHPDHNCWFSPYTLKNVIEKYTNLKVKEIHLSNYNLMVICICERR